MIYTHAQFTHSKSFGFVLMILAVVLLGACGNGGNGDDSESIGETSIGTVEDIPADETAEPFTGSPVSGDEAFAGSPDAAVFASPGVNVSSPPIMLPTMTPTEPPSSGTPASDDSASDFTNASGTEDSVAGDGTGGAVSLPGNAEPDASETVAASPEALTVSVVSTVDSCSVSVYAAYTGADAEQMTTSDLDLMAGPGSDCDVLDGPIPAGTQIEVLSDPIERTGDDQLTWLAVSIDGAEGWLASENLEPVGSGQ